MARTAKQSAGSLGSDLAQATGAMPKEWAGKFVKGTTIKAIREAYGAESGSMKATDASIQRAVDDVKASIDASKVTMAVALKGNAKTNPVRAEVATMFATVFDHLSESAQRNYCTSFFLALEFGRPFMRNDFVNNKKVRDEARVKAGKKVTKRTSGTVSRTSWESAGKTVAKLIEQLELLKAGAPMRKSASALQLKIVAKVEASEAK